ncbi:MAG: 1-acyl-sn-glycerol-3-phosphate acyltransferase [Bacteroidales bacterium]|jgi:1-acyl-sn-glycerol-3-phosphate acyltransferase|nr:1-acyl-sn-glycerol-3-phosphate acyltransferase [Bacteroidales bacterium]
MRKIIGKFILKVFGWKLYTVYPKEDKMVVIVAPHTTIMDFVWGLFAWWVIGVKPNFLIKKELFFFPLNYILKAFGGIPVNRTHAASIPLYCKKMFDAGSMYGLTITPEGTRKKTNRWKRGFYFISEKADVPIYLAFLDYKRKTLGIFMKFEKTGDVELDMQRIKNFYVNVYGKHPKLFSEFDDNPSEKP